MEIYGKDNFLQKVNESIKQLYLSLPEKKKSAIKSPNISNFFRQRSGYISDFTLIYPEKNLADFRGFNSTNPLYF